MIDFETNLLAMEPDGFQRLQQAVIAAQKSDGQPGANLRAQPGAGSAPLYEARDGVAVLDVAGPILRGANPALDHWGIKYVSQAKLRDGLAAAVADPQVRAILLHVDSPGGVATGLTETADAVAAANRVKPVTVYADNLLASAAYFLAAPARAIYAGPEALVGSIGTVWVIYDYSKLFEDAGIKVNAIASGPYKGAATPGTPLTDKQREYFQGMVDEFAGLFKAAVVRGRGLKPAAVEALADGRVHIGKTAQALGLVDGIQSFSVTLAQAQRTASAAGGRAANAEAPPEPKQDPMEDAQMSATQTSATNAVDASAVEKAKAEAQAAERKRLGDLKAAFPDDPAFAMQAFEAGQSVTEAKAAYCDVLAKKLAAQAAELKAAQAQATSAPQETSGKLPGNQALDDGGQTAARGGDPVGEFRAEIEKEMQAYNCTREQAAMRVNRRRPELPRAIRALAAAGN